MKNADKPNKKKFGRSSSNRRNISPAHEKNKARKIHTFRVEFLVLVSINLDQIQIPNHFSDQNNLKTALCGVRNLFTSK